MSFANVAHANMNLTFMAVLEIIILKMLTLQFPAKTIVICVGYITMRISYYAFKILFK